MERPDSLRDAAGNLIAYTVASTEGRWMYLSLSANPLSASDALALAEWLPSAAVWCEAGKDGANG